MRPTPERCQQLTEWVQEHIEEAFTFDQLPRQRTRVVQTFPDATAAPCH
ncbi:MAG: hypothetical protein OXC19_08830 [Bryobacterales bacterium]|nr:hypothetical protein [Bryobacterales bacterium]